jgi:acyl transferase domain-containing protein
MAHPAPSGSAGTTDPTGAIAIIGLSCRLPQAPDPAAFWQLLAAAGSGICATPADRDGRPPLGGTPAADTDPTGADPTGAAGTGPAGTGGSARAGGSAGAGGAAGADPWAGTRRGGYLDRIDLFDPGFFGISPREAAAMDPQQRLMLELGWQAFEDAAIVPGTLSGSRTGVFVGTIWSDWATLQYRRGGDSFTPHTLPGIHRSIIANRVSYAFDLRGPSLTVDSGQSSSLVAVHLACVSLRSGESEVALAGGVNLNLATESLAASARFGGLSPTGQVAAFGQEANGYVRGEGGALLVLKPLARAIEDGDQVYCVIRGSAVNNDGGTDGLTVPSPQAQAEVIQAACRQAGVAPADIQYVELHGSGTRVGDPIEAAGLGAALGAGRDAGAPLLVGSVKTNIGHLEGAAGVAGLLKTVLSIRHRAVPASLHAETTNQGIPLDTLNLAVAQRLGPWPRPDRPLLAGVSSFGMGGTNCHVVLSEPAGPPAEPHPGPAGTGLALPWLVSGRTDQALRDQAGRLAEFAAADPELLPADVGYSLATTRTHFEHRAAVYGADRESLLAGLRALAVADPAANVVGPVKVVRPARPAAGRAGQPPAAVTFIFPGQGSQWAGMAAGLFDSAEVFRKHLYACADALDPLTGWSLIDLLTRQPWTAEAERADVVQPALFAVMTSLARLWQSVGVQPDAVVGHSQGEIAAAYVAGALSLPDAARVVALRSQAISAITGRGGMASVALPAAEVEQLIASWSGRLGVAAVNGPGSTVVSGDADALDELLALRGDTTFRARRVPVDYASHSAHVEAVRGQLLTALAGIQPRPAEIAFCSTLTGGLIDTGTLDAGYWYENLRRPVLFEPATRTLLARGQQIFIEASSHPVLLTGLEETLDAAGASAAAVPTLRRDDGDWPRFLASLCGAHAHGAAVNWDAVFEPAQPHRVALPGYPFQRERYWLAPAAAGGTPTEVPASTVDTVVADVVDPWTAELAPWPRRLAAVAVAERPAALLGLVRASVAGVLGHARPEQVETDRAFKELGFDSSTAVELRNQLSSATGLGLPTTLLFDHPTPDAVAALLSRELWSDAPGAPQSVLADFAQLEAAVLGAPPDDLILPQLATRVQGFLFRLRDLQGTGAAASPDGGIESASDDEIFSFIDSELGLLENDN